MRYAGVIGPTVGPPNMDEPTRKKNKTTRKYLFEEYLKALENRSAQFIVALVEHWHPCVEDSKYGLGIRI